ncbi:tRNA pseudouridine synthase 1 [Colletotrichum spaethianum]|uniref:tRNA pseudouridine synthase 1 n=1 Tax=Colletotrichum spaethianum TaxID=700344 RepID=A0AA37L5E6_9PEZI|nr:tRNA pseudouridine synthase 1 [Colletotrichum spaethianum]GKT42341.1 tRNA pseudouridine synthase 1 [Colletotrichum spaethianum]
MRPPAATLARWRTPSLSPRRTLLRSNPAPTLAVHQHDHRRRTLLTLAIETSCDDTCVALLSKDPGPHGRATLHFNRKITCDSTAYGGVYPPVALRSHDAHLAPLVAEALASLPPVEEHPKDDDGTLGSVARVTAARYGGGGGGGTMTVSGVPRQKPTFVTVTRGPGMSANLASGLATAKGLATAWQVPLLAVNHMQAHALTPRLVSALDRPTSPASSSSPDPASASSPVTPEYPFLTLLVSGGHTQLVHSRSLTDHRILATSIDVAVGDALDKAARHILPPDVLASHGDVMYGALLERFAFPESFAASPSSSQGHDYEYAPPLRRVDEITTYASPYSWSLTPPLATSRALSYAFAGLGSQIHKIATSKPDADAMPLEERRCLARAAMRLLFEHLASRVFLALAAQPELRDAVKTLVVSGGVASNRFLMHVLRRTLDVRGLGHVELTAPPPALCTDNAAMIAWTGMEMYEAGWESELSVHPERKWSIDPASDEGGILGLGGWDTPAAEVERLLVRQVVAVLSIQDTVGEGLTTADAEKVAGKASAVRIDVVERGALLLGDAGTHGAHAEAHALVRVDEVGEDLGGGGDRDAALVAELVKAALHAEPGEPVLAVGSAAGHGAQEYRVDLDDLLDCLRGDPVSGCGTGVGGDDDATLEAEGEGRCAVGDLDGAVGVGAVVCCCAEPRGRLD